MNEYDKLKEIIASSNKITFFTGAGISVPSGIPDFRSSNGIYNTNLNAEEILSHHYFINHVESFYEFYKKHMVFENAEPNIAHKWIRTLEEQGKKVTIVTQNIDGLHQLAGSSCVLELHGSIHRNHCLKCGKKYSLDKISASKNIPLCDCGGIIRPDVILYEEQLDEKTIYDSIDAISNCDALIVIGTSLVVYPAASFIHYYRGNKLVLLNKSATRYDSVADLIINEDITNIIERIKRT